MDLYSDPPPSTYLLGFSKPFRMPTETGTIPAVAVTKTEGEKWNSGYTLLITIMFVAVGKLVIDLVLVFFPLRKNPNRHAMVIALYNTGDMFSATFLMLNYMYKILRNVRTETSSIDWSTFFSAFGLFILSAGVFAATTIAGLYIPQDLLIGSYARVNPEAMFYFRAQAANASAQATLTDAFTRLNTVAAMRAVGIYEQSKNVLRDKVSISASFGRPGDEVPFSFDYSYDVTGFDFGLQREPTLKQTVRANCKTEYSWFLRSNGTIDQYVLWPDTPFRTSFRVSVQPTAIPSARFVFPDPLKFPQYVANVTSSGTVPYVIVPFIASRESLYENEFDPWYQTEPNPRAENSTSAPPFRIKRGRPVISCTETLLWALPSGNVPTLTLSAMNRNGTVNLKLADFWLDTVFAREFVTTPKIVSIGRALGAYSLSSVSQDFLLNQHIQTPIANLTYDMERLALSAYVGAREVVRNTAGNGTKISDEELDYRADFVIESSEVQTLSLSILIIMPCLFVLVWLIVAFKRPILSLRKLTVNNESHRSRYVARATAYSGVQLYRYLDEELFGKRRWDGRLSGAPYVAKVSQDYKDSETFDGRGLEVVPVCAQVAKEDVSLKREKIPEHHYVDCLNAEATVTDPNIGQSDPPPAQENDAETADRKRPSIREMARTFSSSYLGRNRQRRTVDQDYHIMNLECVEPKLVPLYRHAAPEDDAPSATRVAPVASTDASDGNRRYLTAVSGRFELAMVPVYRRQLLKEMSGLKWDHVETKTHRETEEQEPVQELDNVRIVKY